MFWGTIFPCDAGSQRRNVCDAAIWAAMHAMRSRQHGMFPAIWALRCETAMRIARFAMRDAGQLSLGALQNQNQIQAAQAHH